MIHKAWTFTAGNADDLLHTAEMLEKLDASLVDTYAKKNGLYAGGDRRVDEGRNVVFRRRIC